MRHRALPVSLLLFVALTGCAATDTIPDHSAVRALARQEVQERMNAYSAAVRSGDMITILGFWAADARIQESESQVDGPEVTQRAQEFFPHNQVTEFSVQALDLQAHDEGGVAYLWGQLTEAVQPNEAGAATWYRTNFLARWARAADGEWRIHRFLAVPAAQPLPEIAARKAAEAPVGSLDDVIAVDQVTASMQEYVTALRSNNVDSILSFWTDDATFTETVQMVAGKPALERLMRDLLGRNRVTRFELTSREIFVHDNGGSAYQFGGFVEALQPINGDGPARVGRCNFVARWRRGADGNWRMDAFMATPAPK